MEPKLPAKINKYPETPPKDKHPDSIWSILDDISNMYTPDEKEKQGELMSKTLIGKTLDDTKTIKGIPDEDRESHFYIIGGTGTGKSRFMESLIAQEVHKERGFGVIDPHGDLISDVKAMLILQWGSIKHAEDHTILIDPTDKEYSVCLNPLEPIEGVDSAVIAGEIVDAFEKIWGKKGWGARMQQIFKNALVALIENNLTLREVPLILNDPSVRRWLLRNVKDEICLEFFEKYERWSEHDKTINTESTLNKLDDFLSHPNVRDMFLSPKSSFNMREAIDSGDTILVNLDVGQLKPNASSLLGSIILSKIQMTAFSRSDIDESVRVPFHLYIDEFQEFANENFVKVLSQSRKYGLYLTLAHQDLAQLHSELRASIMSNCELMASFRVSRDDADIMAKELFGGVSDDVVPWEQRVQRLQKFKERQFIFKNRKKGGIALLEAFNTPPIWDKYTWGREDYLTNRTGKWEGDIGKNTRRKRSEIRAEYIERRKKLGEPEEPESFWRNPA